MIYRLFAMLFGPAARRADDSLYGFEDDDDALDDSPIPYELGEAA